MNNDRHHRRFLPHAVQNFLWGFSRAGRHHHQQQQQEQQQIPNHIQDREMTPVEDLPVHEQHPSRAIPPQSNNVDADNRSDTSMPDLQSVSDSDSDSDSQDARDVEMQVVEDDQNNDWTDDEDNIPPLESIPQSERNNRRARVEDDQESSPSAHSHTTNPASPNNDDQAPRPNIPPWSFGLGTARGPPPPDFRRLFPLFSQGGPLGPQPQHNPHPDENTPPPPGQGRPHLHAHAYVLAMDANGRTVPVPMGPPPPPGDAAPQPVPQPQGMPIFDFIIGTGPGGLGGGMFNAPPPAFGADVPTWAEIMQMFGREAEEREDPERAQKLVTGLEQVPVGLVKRMIQVGGAPGGHVDEAQTLDSETPGCAICWDTLLTEASNEGDVINQETEIICLPCSHVFHASCLVPWFSKPRHTTCPTCRFNIDPENLTYTPRQAQPRGPGTPSGEQPAGSTPQEQPGEEQPEVPAEADQPRIEPNVQNSEPAVNPANLNTFFFPPPPPIPNQGDAPRNIHHHGHTHGPGFTVDFTWQVPNNGEQDDERIAEDLQNQASAFVQQFLGGIGMGGFPLFGGPMPQTGLRSPPPFGTTSGTPAGQSRPRKEWSPPPAPGPTLRQRIETKEREAGLRCDDASCGIGPSDEDPYPSQSHDNSSSKQVSISQQLNHNLHVCSHKFHPSCLVSADRCSGWGEDVEREKPPFEVVACPMCRAIGNVPREVWDEGAKTLLN